MSDQTIAGAVLMGLVEGTTEFLPVSSTAHLLLLGDIIGFDSTGKAFEIMIQPGAILAIVLVYFRRLWNLAVTLPYNPRSRLFAGGVILAFLPSAALGATLHGFIKTVLFETPVLICIMLIVGGIILLVIDNLSLTTKYHNVMDYPLSLCFKIGLFQCLAIIPGVSRSGATIVGSLLMGTDKRSAAEFSFFLAMPTMAGAFAYDFYKNYGILSASDLQYIGVGFIAAFLSALLVVNSFLDFVSRHGFAVFGWWRIVLGCVTLAWLYLT